MELSLFLAKLFGIYLLVITSLWAVRAELMSQVIEEFVASRAMMFLSGLIALLVGIAMAIGHSVWEPNWRGLITFLGYGAIAKGVVRIAYPEIPKRAVGLMLQGSRKWVWLALAFAMGGYLTWIGFTHG